MRKIQERIQWLWDGVGGGGGGGGGGVCAVELPTDSKFIFSWKGFEKMKFGMLYLP